MGPAASSRRLPSETSVPKSLIARLGFFLAMALSGSDDFFGLRINDNGAGHIDINADFLSGLAHVAGLKLGNNALAAQWKGDLNARAGGLHQFDRDLDLRMAHGNALAGKGDMLRPDAENDGLLGLSLALASKPQLCAIRKRRHASV